MGTGSHKLLDYMSLALNLPLEYHPHSAFSAKYTKTMQNLLEVKNHIHNVLGLKTASTEEVSESQRIIIRSLNESVYLNNQLYSSDFDEELF
jgi:predicted DNA-binding ArsR family transcriptional regulator